MSESSHTSPLRNLLLGLLLLLFPIAGVYYGFQAWSGEIRRQQLRTAAEDLQQICAHLHRLSQPVFRYQETLDRLVRRIAAAEIDDLTPASHTSELMELFFFSAEGKRIFPCTLASRRFTTASEKTFQYLQRVQKLEDPIVSKADQRLIESFLGAVGAIPLLAHGPNQLIDLSRAGTPRLGAFFKIPFKGTRTIYLLALIDRRHIDQQALIVSALDTIHRLAGAEYRFGWLDLRNPRQRGMADQRPFPAAWVPLVAGYHLSPAHQTSRRLFYQITLDRTLRLFGTRRLPPVDPRVPFVRQLLIIGTLGAVLVFLWFWGYQAFPTVPLRMQLLLLFGCIGTAGILCLLSNARQYRENREQVMIREQQTRAARILEKVDSSFLPAFQTLVARYRQVLDTLYEDPKNLVTACVQLQRWRRDGSLLAGLVVDRNGKTILRVPEENALGAQSALASKGEGILGHFARRIIEVFNGQETKQAAGKTESRGMYQTLLSRQLDLVIRERGTLITLNIGDDESVSFIDLAITAAGRAEHCFFLMHQKTQMEHQFLQRMTRRLSGDKAPLRLYARPKIPGAGLRSFPAGFERHPELTRISEAALQADGAVHRQVLFDGSPMILSTLPGREVSDYVLILGTPLQRIIDHSRRLTRRFLAISALVIVFALFLGWLFSSTLLQPIEQLSVGIDHLTHMRFQSTVSVKTGDELETIGDGLNTVLAEFHEVAMARTVQEHLLPAGGLKLGDVYCHGWSRSSAEIGGEMYDFFESAPGRWVILLADSTAYGISAAILMAMTKMAVRLLAEETQSDSSALVTGLHRYYRDHVPQLKRLFLFLAVFEPASGELDYTATSDVQLHFQPAGSAGTRQPCGATPLGAGAVGDLLTYRFRLTPGSRLFVASDGMPAAFASWCDRDRAMPAEEMGPHLFRLADRHPAGSALPDQTILLLEKPA